MLKLLSKAVVGLNMVGKIMGGDKYGGILEIKNRHIIPVINRDGTGS